ncbi:hypothetical protein L1887_55723 [Cichorium endivia]|nr:hypothetical protein L1887_55723 [Cichorium endivia]
MHQRRPGRFVFPAVRMVQRKRCVRVRLVPCESTVESATASRPFSPRPNSALVSPTTSTPTSNTRSLAQAGTTRRGNRSMWDKDCRGDHHRRVTIPSSEFRTSRHHPAHHPILLPQLASLCGGIGLKCMMLEIQIQCRAVFRVP